MTESKAGFERATKIAKAIFRVGDEPDSPCKRLQFMGGDWPDSEHRQGGIGFDPLVNLIAANLAEPPAPTPPGLELPDGPGTVWKHASEPGWWICWNFARDLIALDYLNPKGHFTKRVLLEDAPRGNWHLADLPGVVQAAQDAERADLRQKLEAERQREEKAERELGDLSHGYDVIRDDLATLRQQLADVTAERDEARAIIAKHDLCHNQHGKVDARAFADGCANEQRKEFGCAPDADEVSRLTAENQRLTAESAAMRSVLREHGVGVAGDYSEYCVYCDYSENGKVAHRPTCILSSSTAGTVLLAENQRLRGVLLELRECHDPNWYAWRQRIDSAIAQPSGEPTP